VSGGGEDEGNEEGEIKFWRRDGGKWKSEGGLRVGEGDGPVLSVEWGVDDDFSMGRILVGGGGSNIRIFGIDKLKAGDGVVDGEKNIWSFTSLKVKLLSCLERSHEDNDVNCVTWCRNTLVETQGKWDGLRDLIASVGDDGETKIWRLQKTI
jgi:WD40 repeat protein